MSFSSGIRLNSNLCIYLRASAGMRKDFTGASFGGSEVWMNPPPMTASAITIFDPPLLSWIVRLRRELPQTFV